MPPSEAIAPPATTAQNRVRCGSIPALAAACGFSPHARTRKPHGVRSRKSESATAVANARTISTCSPSGPNAGTWRDAPGCPNTSTSPKAAAPSATMLQPMPATIWSNPRRVATNARSAASSAPARTPAAAPASALPVAPATATAVNAPAIMVPSRAMFTTPARSASTPPSAAKINGVALINVKPASAAATLQNALTSTAAPRRSGGPRAQ